VLLLPCSTFQIDNLKKIIVYSCNVFLAKILYLLTQLIPLKFEVFQDVCSYHEQSICCFETYDHRFNHLFITI